MVVVLCCCCGLVVVVKGLGVENSETPTTTAMYQNCSILGSFKTPLSGVI
jgi:hypothetical protein